MPFDNHCERHAVVEKVLPTSALTRWSILLTFEMTAKFDLGPPAVKQAERVGSHLLSYSGSFHR